MKKSLALFLTLAYLTAGGLWAKPIDLTAGFGRGQRVLLDPGRVEVMAQVTLNGKLCGMLWMPPYTLDVTDDLMSGSNTFEVKVTSTSTGKPALGGVQLRTPARLEINTF
ncbi:MAG: hypothetical protein HC901_02915 [Bdellovibrionaceae bacterium]|nr:hypothetical protein [Pseudobdellovibrionaceae bacterium]